MSSYRKPTLFMTLEDTLVRTCESKLLERKSAFQSLPSTSVFLSNKKTVTHAYLRPGARSFIEDIQEYLHLKIISHYTKKDIVKICINLGLPYEDSFIISLNPREDSDADLHKAKKENSHRRWVLFDNGYCPEMKFKHIHPASNPKFWKKNEYRSPFVLKRHSDWDLTFHLLPVLDHMEYFKSASSAETRKERQSWT